MEDYVTLERSDDVMIVRFDRKGALNAFDQKMITEYCKTSCRRSDPQKCGADWCKRRILIRY
jgi:hypothetical protein